MRTPRGTALAAGVLVAGLSIVGLLFGRAVPASAAGIEPDPGPPAPREPLQHFFGEAEISYAKISPSGKYVAAFKQLENGYPNLVLIDLETRQTTPITNLKKKIGHFWWINEQRIIFSVITRGGRTRRLHGIRPDGSRHKKFVWPDHLVSLLPRDRKHVLIAQPYSSTPRRVASRVLRLNVYTGNTRVWSSSNRAAKRWIADAEGDVRIGYGEVRATGFFIYRRGRGHPWVPLGDDRFPLDELSFVPLGFTNDRERIYVSARVESDRFAIHEYDVRTQEFSPSIFSDPVFDVSGPLRFSVDEHGQRKLVGVDYQADFPRIHWLDEHWQRLARDADEALPGRQNRLLGTSADGSVILLLSTGDRHPGSYYLHYPEKGKIELLGRKRPQLEPERMAHVRPIHYPARDGVQIPAYLALPRGYKGGRVPVVINPHGGPWARDDREFDPVLQFLANRGWAVLRPNFRGSSGYGLEFQKLGYRQWGEAMQDDITDGVRWLIDQGIADPDRICIYGTSYGGYATLVGLIETPELYRCGAAYAAPSDLRALIAEREWHDDRDLWRRLIGDRRDEREFLEENSPLHRVELVARPVFVGHGRNDRVISWRQTKRLVKALKRANKPHESHIMKNEGHGLYFEENRLDYYARLEAFLSRHLDGPVIDP